jgi:hypothetical protein
MTTGKAAVASKSVQGSVVALIGSVLLVLEQFGKLPPGSGATIAGAAGAILGPIWALIGAIGRKQPITSVF